MFADTTKKYDKLISLDGEFAKQDFNNELLQHRDVDIRLKPLYKFNIKNPDKEIMALDNPYESKAMDSFVAKVDIPIELSAAKKGYELNTSMHLQEIERKLADKSLSEAELAKLNFAKGIIEAEDNRFNSALEYYDKSIEKEPEQTFYYINRGALQSEIIDFISSIESNVQILTLDNSGAARARVHDRGSMSYDYTPAIHDMTKAMNLYPDFPFVYYNLGNLYCLSGDLPESINQYTKALELYPKLAEAYFNRGLVLIYLKDNEKGCLDLSKAGELGVSDAYTVIKKYCLEEE